MFFDNIAIKDLFDTFRKFRSWIYLAYFDLKLKYRKTYLGPWWVVLGMAISAGLLCLLWSVIFKLDWQNYLIYIFSGFIIWTWLMTIIIEGPEIFAGNSDLLRTFAIPPIFHVLRRSFLNLLLFIHHLPLIFILVLIMEVNLNLRVIITLPFGILLVFINAFFYSTIIGILAARFRDIEPTIKAIMAPMLLLTPVLWKPEMLGSYHDLIYLNPFTFFIGIIRNDLIGIEFDIVLWIGALLITILQFVIYILLYTFKKNRIIFWV